METIFGVIVKGLGGAARSLSELQSPLFKNLGLPIAGQFHKGTINIDITPNKFEVLGFDYLLKNIEWEPGRFEDFGFVVIKEIKHNGRNYSNPGYIYVPHSSPHFTNHSQLEIWAVPIHNAADGDSITFSLDDKKLKLK